MENFYKDFDLIAETDIPDANGKGIYLYHKKTGLEIFHILNDDTENLFGFCFRTPVKNSMGCAHIMEHSVLCGSEKFPLKEPFTNLCNQSIKTFLNAMTYPDKTVYPASSLNKADYFNLMDVYADSVFFPLLSENTFLQEAHRLEKDENGKYSIQGVVYNEMKGVFSSFSSASYRAVSSALFNNSCYAESSGGDPLHITEFTYEEFKAFHHKYYSPSNCLLFLYGNIPTVEQLDFIEEKFLNRLEKKYAVPSLPSKLPFFPKEIEDIEKSNPISEMVTYKTTGPDSDAEGSTVSVNWKWSDCHSLNYIMETSYLWNFLFNNDSSPLRKALLDSKLGKRLSGMANSHYESSIGFGLTGVEEQNASKVKDIIFDTLKFLADGNINQKDIDAAVLSCDFANREITRNYGPFALTLLERAVDAWQYGDNPGDFLLYREGFDKVKQNLASDKNYTQKLIKKYFLDNKQCAFVTITPDKTYLEERNKSEEELIKKLTLNIDEDKLKKDLDRLHAYQEHTETEEEVSCIPNIKPEDLEPKANLFETEVTSIKANDGTDIPLFLNKEGTNGIVYIDLFTPIDTVPVCDYKYLSSLCSVLLDTGWNNKKWDQTIGETSILCGDFYSELIYSSPGVGENAKKYFESVKDKNYVNRMWLNISMKMTIEKAKDALALFAEAYNYMQFDDEERIKTLLAQMLNGKKSSILPNGSWYASIRAGCTKSKANALDEILKGIRGFFNLIDITEMPVKELIEKFTSMYSSIKKGGNILHITADEKTLEEIQTVLPEFVKATNISAPKPAPNVDEKELYELTKLPGQNEISSEEYFTIPTQVGYAAKFVSFDKFDGKDSAAATVLSHWMSNTLLWEKIRTKGGAYGANASSNGLDFTFDLSTYRDPTPLKSLSAFDEALTEAEDTNLSKEDVARSVTGSYSSQKQPYSPETHGFIAFKNTIYGVLQEECDDYVQKILSVTADDLKQSAKKIISANSTKRTAVICDEKTEISSGSVIKIPV